MNPVQPQISHIYQKQREKPGLVGVLEKKNFKTIFQVLSQLKMLTKHIKN